MMTGRALAGRGGADQCGVSSGRQRAVERDIEAELDFDGALAGVDRVLAQLDSADAADGDAELDGGGLAAGGVVLGFFQRQDDIDGFDEWFHGGEQAGMPVSRLAADGAFAAFVIDADEGDVGGEDGHVVRLFRR